MHKIRLSLAAVALLVLAACSGSHHPESPKQKPAGVIPKAELDTLNQAKALQDTVNQAEQERQKQLNQ